MKGSFFRSLSWIAMMIHCVRSFHVLVSRTNRVSLSTSLGLQSSLLPGIQQQRFSWRLLSTAGEASEEKKRVVFVGTPEVAATSLKSLYENSLEDGSYEIVSVITQPPKRRKRNGKLEHSPVGKVAEEIGLPILCPEKVRRMFSLALSL
jgi:FlaA1/EpsC-like NDP-sugar epimerase